MAQTTEINWIDLKDDEGKKKAPSSKPGKRTVLDKAKLLKLLNDEESDLSSDTEEEGGEKINADSSDNGKFISDST